MHSAAQDGTVRNRVCGFRLQPEDLASSAGLPPKGGSHERFFAGPKAEVTPIRIQRLRSIELFKLQTGSQSASKGIIMRADACYRRICLTLALTMAVVATVGAHDFWIEASNFNPSAGESVSLYLRVGERFVGEAVPRNDSRIEKFFVAAPSGERPVVGRHGMDPAGLLRPEAPGTWIVGYRSRPSRVELGAAEFEKYLTEEGLDRIIDERSKRGESRVPGREMFSRSVKTLLRVGSGDASGFDRVLGMALELVPERDPWNAPGPELPVRLLAHGKPLEGVLIVVLKRPGADGSPVQVARTRSDRDGRVTIPTGEGVWLIKAVHMTRAESAGAEWESIWTSLTFQVSRPAGDI
jgi:uncharacterized GH25 family protein